MIENDQDRGAKSRVVGSFGAYQANIDEVEMSVEILY